jgi:hypothetical protein
VKKIGDLSDLELAKVTSQGALEPILREHENLTMKSSDLLSKCHRYLSLPSQYSETAGTEELGSENRYPQRIRRE